MYCTINYNSYFNTLTVAGKPRYNCYNLVCDHTKYTYCTRITKKKYKYLKL